MGHFEGDVCEMRHVWHVFLGEKLNRLHVEEWRAECTCDWKNVCPENVSLPLYIVAYNGGTSLVFEEKVMVTSDRLCVRALKSNFTEWTCFSYVERQQQGTDTRSWMYAMLYHC